jgi:hypothetical protein
MQRKKNLRTYLLGYDGRIHYYDEGYWLKFEFKRVHKSNERPQCDFITIGRHEEARKALNGKTVGTRRVASSRRIE